MPHLLDRINRYRCLVKKGDKFVLGDIVNTNIYQYDDYKSRLATTSQRTKFKYFVECLIITSINALDIGSKIKYPVDDAWYYVVDQISVTDDQSAGGRVYKYVIGR